jgi:hypothetical protein
MTEQNQTPDIAADDSAADAEGHVFRDDTDDANDADGHMFRDDAGDTDDTEGHFIR